MTELGFSRDEAIALSIDVWRGFLGIELDVLDKAMPIELPAALMTAGVTLKGQWYGGVLLAYPVALGDQAARLALGIDEASLDDICDVVGEIINMISAGLKYYMPGRTEMSLPIVATGAPATICIPGAREVMVLGFRIDGMPFRLSVVCTEA